MCSYFKPRINLNKGHKNLCLRGLLYFLELKNVINTDIYDNLVNGVSGTVVDFLWRKRSGADNSHVVAVLVQFDDPTVGQNLRRKHKGLHDSIKSNNAVPIFQAKQIPHKKHSDMVSVEQFPLNLVYSSTSHKIQGGQLKDIDVVCHLVVNLCMKLLFSLPIFQIYYCYC